MCICIQDRGEKELNYCLLFSNVSTISQYKRARLERTNSMTSDPVCLIQGVKMLMKHFRHFVCISSRFCSLRWGRFDARWVAHLPLTQALFWGIVCTVSFYSAFSCCWRNVEGMRREHLQVVFHKFLLLLVPSKIVYFLLFFILCVYVWAIASSV